MVQYHEEDIKPPQTKKTPIPHHHHPSFRRSGAAALGCGTEAGTQEKYSAEGAPPSLHSNPTPPTLTPPLPKLTPAPPTPPPQTNRINPRKKTNHNRKNHPKQIPNRPNQNNIIPPPALRTNRPLITSHQKYPNKKPK